MSPFCTLGKGAKPAKWAEEVKNIYKKNHEMMPDYVKSFESPIRKSYPSDSFKEAEIMTNLAEVRNNRIY